MAPCPPRFLSTPRSRPGAGPRPRMSDSDEGAFGREPVVVPIEDSIDLHHFRPSEIPEVVDAYLEAAVEAGFREVRLIHGRGKGVQRGRVRGILARDPRVLHQREATPQRGGWGATIAWLRLPDGESPDPGGDELP